MLPLLSLLLLLAACDQAPSTPAVLPPAITPSVTPTPAGIAQFPVTMVTNPRTSASDFQAGVSLLLYGNDVSYQVESLPLLNHLASDNVNSLSIVIPLFQSSHSANDIHTDPVQTPSDDELTWIVAQAHRRGFSILLRPVLDEASVGPLPHWRGDIQPSDPTIWFANYSAILLHYANLAQQDGIEALDIGTELDTMEAYSADWSSLITQISSVYSNSLTYSANWNGPRLNAAITRHLTFISVDAYYPVTSVPSPSLAQIVAGWQGSGLKDLKSRAQAAGLPVVITEIGAIPTDGVFAKPWSWSPTGAYDPQVQQDYYTATCQALKPAVTGIYWWEVGLTQPLAPNGGFNPLVLPGTEQAMSDCYATPTP
jgi:hypothetical protein